MIFLYIYIYKIFLIYNCMKLFLNNQPYIINKISLIIFFHFSYFTYNKNMDEDNVSK